MSVLSVPEQLQKASRAGLKRQYPDWSEGDLDKAVRRQGWLWPRIAHALPDGHTPVRLVSFGMAAAQFPSRSRDLCLVASRAAVSTFTFSVLTRSARELATVLLPAKEIRHKKALLGTAVLEIRDRAGNLLRFESGRPAVEYLLAFLEKP